MHAFEKCVKQIWKFLVFRNIIKIFKVFKLSSSSFESFSGDFSKKFFNKFRKISQKLVEIYDLTFQYSLIYLQIEKGRKRKKTNSKTSRSIVLLLSFVFQREKYNINCKTTKLVLSAFFHSLSLLCSVRLQVGIKIYENYRIILVIVSFSSNVEVWLH